MEREFVTVARLAEMPAMGGLEVTLEGRRLAVFLTPQGEVFATDALCPHRGALLSAGWVEGGKIFCGQHGWEFDLRTGACREHEDRPVACHEARVIGDEVQVRMARLRSGEGRGVTQTASRSAEDAEG